MIFFYPLRLLPLVAARKTYWVREYYTEREFINKICAETSLVFVIWHRQVGSAFSVLLVHVFSFLAQSEWFCQVFPIHWRAPSRIHNIYNSAAAVLWCGRTPSQWEGKLTPPLVRKKHFFFLLLCLFTIITINIISDGGGKGLHQVSLASTIRKRMACELVKMKNNNMHNKI